LLPAELTSLLHLPILNKIIADAENARQNHSHDIRGAQGFAAGARRAYIRLGSNVGCARGAFHIYIHTYRRASTADHSGHYRHYEHTTTQSSPAKTHRHMPNEIRRLPCLSPRCSDSRTTQPRLDRWPSPRLAWNIEARLELPTAYQPQF